MMVIILLLEVMRQLKKNMKRVLERLYLLSMIIMEKLYLIRVLKHWMILSLLALK